MPSTDPLDLLSAWLGEPGGQRDAVLRVLLELAVSVAGSEEGSLLLLDGATRELVFATTIGDRASAEALRGQRIPWGRGLVGLAAQTHEVQIGSPTYGDVKQAGHRAEAGGPAWTLAAPVLVHDELVGVVTAVTFSTERPLGSDSAELFGRVAAVAGVLLDQGRRLAAASGEGPTSDAARAQAEAAATALIARAARDPAKLARLARVLSDLEAML
jgi:GAF domain-containing protein